jgi:hypothetical protein
MDARLSQTREPGAPGPTMNDEGPPGWRPFEVWSAGGD